jgi:hypothetical protein
MERGRAAKTAAARIWAKELPVVKSQIFKWAAAGILALGAIPAIGMGRSHVSLPTSAVTITPTRAKTRTSLKTSHVVHKTSARVHKASTRKHTAVRSHAKRTSAVSHRKASPVRAKTAASSHRVKSVSLSTHRPASHKTIKHA